ncbi:MAG: glycosyl transferase family protein [Betaproteobacteria bacterium]|nr:glycosyl transferase family protein [Betaproteobacteria bacterium]
MSEEHQFAPFIRILGKGKNGSRSLTQDEAYHAMRMILADEVEPLQLGAFLMLLRVKEESPEELAGFVLAAREAIVFPDNAPAVDVDWSSYAGKRRQLPWFLLSTLLLASHGVNVFMHAIGGRKDDRVYTPETLTILGITPCDSVQEAANRIRDHHFAFMSLEALSPKLYQIIGMRSLLGLRSPVHTLARMLNPMRAPVMMQGIFHPAYRDMHQLAAQLLNQPHVAVIKGEGGEIERDPDSACLVKGVHNGELTEETWPPMFDNRHVKDASMDIQRLPALWHGDIVDEYGLAAVVGTTAITLKTMGRADTQNAALKMAQDMWAQRPASWPV